MTGFTDDHAPSGILGAIQLADDTKEDRSGFLSVLATTGAITTAVIITFAVALLVELTWRERRQRRQEAATASAPDHAPREGELSP